jgi:hypothetical protein
MAGKVGAAAPPPPPAVIAHDADSYSGEGGALVTSLTWNHTCTGSNRLLVIGVLLDGGGTPGITASATYNGVAMTVGPDGQVMLATDASRFIILFYLVNPDAGTHQVAITFSANVRYPKGGGVSLTGVSQSSPLDAHASAHGTTETTQSLSITTVADNAWIVDALGTTNPNQLYTVISPQVAAWNSPKYATNTSANGSYRGPVTPAGATTDGYTAPASPVKWGLAALSFAPG